jgi:hypothetical protein
MVNVIGRHPEQFVLGVAQHLQQPGIGAQDPIRVHAGVHDANGRAIERRPVAILALEQRLPDAASRGKILPLRRRAWPLGPPPLFTRRFLVAIW